ncbi:SPW repeat domain-containing protein [Brucella sp. IR073]|uniref:SPW repeat domain-containing protein n=1 Tax=unclassified Brucella TaxID=2632610 RepID=UPI003B980C39
MAMTNPVGRPGLIQHRGWEDNAIMALGAIIFLSSLFFPATDKIEVVINTMLAGAFVTACGIMEVARLRRWQEVLVFLAGLWVIASPFAFDYSDPLRTWHVALGVIIVAIAALQLWQDRKRRFGT